MGEREKVRKQKLQTYHERDHKDLKQGKMRMIMTWRRRESIEMFGRNASPMGSWLENPT